MRRPVPAADGGLAPPQPADDGLIDPRDTRTVVGIALSAVHSNEVKGAAGFGVFRM